MKQFGFKNFHFLAIPLLPVSWPKVGTSACRGPAHNAQLIGRSFLAKMMRHPLLSSNPPPPRLHLPGIIPPLRSSAGLQDGKVWGAPPVGHALSDDVDSQHSRDLGWATNLSGNGHAKSCTQSQSQSAPAPPTPPRVPSPQVIG